MLVMQHFGIAGPKQFAADARDAGRSRVPDPHTINSKLMLDCGTKAIRS